MSEYLKKHWPSLSDKETAAINAAAPPVEPAPEPAEVSGVNELVAAASRLSEARLELNSAERSINTFSHPENLKRQHHLSLEYVRIAEEFYGKEFVRLDGAVLLEALEKMKARSQARIEEMTA